MFNPTQITRTVLAPVEITTLTQWQNTAVRDFTLGWYRDFTKTQYTGHPLLVKGEAFTATSSKTLANFHFANIQRNNIKQDGTNSSIHFDCFYIRNTTIGQTWIIRDCLAENIACGFILIEAGCAGTFKILENTCRNIGYPAEIIIKPTTAVNKLSIWLDGNVDCDVYLDTSKLQDPLGSCLEIWLGTHKGNLPNFASLGIKVNPIAPVIDPQAECQASLRLCQTTLKNTEAEVTRLNGVVAAKEIERGAAVLEARRQIERNALLARVVETELVTIEQRIAFLREALQ
jgi:hypothetical protein